MGGSSLKDSVDRLLRQQTGSGFDQLIARRRQPGRETSYEKIAREITELTNGVFVLTGMTVRNWADGNEPAETSAANR